MRTTGIDRFVSHSNGRMVLMLLCHVISSMSLCSVLCASVDKRDKTYLYRLFNTQSHYYETLLNIYCLLWVLLLACLNQKAIIPRVHSRQGRVPQCIDRNLFDRRRKFQRIYIYIYVREKLFMKSKQWQPIVQMEKMRLINDAQTWTAPICGAERIG